MIVLGDIFIGDFRISQRFGKNPSMYAKFGLKGHNGIDWATPIGTQLVSCFDCVVLSVKYDSNGYGYHVKLWNKQQNCVAVYGHMQSIKVIQGQELKCGQSVGLSDNTGYSTGPHLHFGICKVNDDGYKLNTGNGYAGWLNPFDGRVFEWKIKNLSEPISGPKPDQEEDVERILKFLQEKEVLNEGKVREMYGAWQDLPGLKKNIEDLQTTLSNKQAALEDKDRVISDFKTELEGFRTQASECQKQNDLYLEELAIILGTKAVYAEIKAQTQTAVKNEGKYHSTVAKQKEAERKYDKAYQQLTSLEEELKKAEAEKKEAVGETERLNRIVEKQKKIIGLKEVKSLKERIKSWLKEKYISTKSWLKI